MEEPLAKDLMSQDVYVLKDTASVLDAARLMKKRKIRGVVIVHHEEVVGILVTRDLVYDVLGAERDPALLLVTEIMSTDLIVSSPETPASELAMIMAKKRISRIPIIDGDQLVGIVTHSDLIRTWPGYFDVLKESLVFDAPSDSES